MLAGPAYRANLSAEQEYIVGVMQFPFSNISDFSAKVAIFHNNESNPYLDFCILNIKEGSKRLARIQPSTTWGGSGLLGMEIGTGILTTIEMQAFLSKRAAALKDREEASMHQVEDLNLANIGLNNMKSFEEQTSSSIVRKKHDEIEVLNPPEKLE